MSSGMFQVQVMYCGTQVVILLASAHLEAILKIYYRIVPSSQVIAFMCAVLGKTGTRTDTLLTGPRQASASSPFLNSLIPRRIIVGKVHFPHDNAPVYEATFLNCLTVGCTICVL